MQRQLESLLTEVRLLSRSVIHLRRDDFRLVFGEQIKPILMERIERFFGKETERSEGTADQQKIKAQLVDLVDRYIADFQREGAEAALHILDEFESAPPGGPADREPRHHELIAGMVAQMRDYMAASDRISHGASSPAGEKVLSATAVRPLSPASVERTLGPLSSSRRIEVLLLLSNDKESLAALSRTLDMKKGHLQFHLNVLIDAGYIAYDRKTHLYALTGKGGRALEGISSLMDNIEAA